MRVLRNIWAILIFLILILIPIQFYLAGHGAFEFPSSGSLSPKHHDNAWGPHALVGTLIGLLTLLQFIVALVCRFPRRWLYSSGLLFVLLIIQFVLGGLGDSLSTRWLAALHPVNALLITGLTLMLAMRARPLLPGGTGEITDDAAMPFVAAR